MGADLLTIRICIDKNKKPDFKAGAKRIAELKKTVITEWPVDYIDRFPDCTGNLAAEADVLSSDLKELKARLAPGDLYRDTNVFFIDRKCVLLTGGFSGGDSPCDFYDSLDRLITAGITEACGFDW